LVRCITASTEDNSFINWRKRSKEDLTSEHTIVAFPVARKSNFKNMPSKTILKNHKQIIDH
jgi:hypothetical protein